MSQTTCGRTATRLAFVILTLSSLSAPRAIYAQVDESIPKLKDRVAVLIKEINYVEALPLLQKIVAAEPNNGEMYFYLGFGFIGLSHNTKDSAERKALRVKAREAWVKAKELGRAEMTPVVDALINSMPTDGSEGRGFSQNAEANDSMMEAEAFFSKGKLDDALTYYQKALKLDPTIYEAALFTADVYSQQGDYANAEIWYQKTIAIDPNRETAYRYSATPFMRQEKYGQARDRYVEAYICEPYGKFAVAGLVQWANVTKTTLAHPKIDIPTNITFDEKGNSNVNIEAPSAGSKADGSFAWIYYGIKRATWHKEKFAKAFPDVKAYRDSVAEEADAIRGVLSLATENKDVKSLSPSLTKLKKLNDDGLLEAYILLARADKDIAQDYAAYLKLNRDKLRRYVVEYILTGGGK